ncbi:HIT-like protein [Wolfiporia cocos MD-104 SS10]|uniref:HIT-like protein n=1 Tax=Wolfiporia cocos (strain MD-104) TaxID=742152 RepID=A0A2H3JXE4_WOLCO|nr:HIT-like protein [Wolfiporia cocos MD-104 SS10]
MFCNVSPENGFIIVWEDETFIVFRDYKPAAMHHLQIIPKQHIDNVKCLSQTDASMVIRMSEIGHRILDELDVPPTLRRLGFHIPPFYSVNHLHMHVQGLPYRSFFKSLKYPVATGRNGHTKGFSWFCEASQAINILENGGRVGIFSC